MFNPRFFQDKVGAAALGSVTAMIAFNVFAASYQLDHTVGHEILTAAMHPVELA